MIARAIVATAVLAAVLVGAVALVGDGSQDVGYARAGEDLPTAPLDAVTVAQHRHLEGTQRIFVALHADEGSDVVVRSIAIATPLFEPVPAEDKESRIGAGQTVDVQVDLGSAVCPDPASASPPQAVLEIDVDGQAVGEAVVDLPDDYLLDRHTRDCAVRAIDETATIALEGGERDGAVVRTVLVLRRQGGDLPVAVEQVQGSVLLTMLAETPPAEGRPLVVLDGDEARLPLRFEANRCDPHSVSASRKTYVFLLWLRLGDGEQTTMDLLPDAELRELMGDAIQACIDARPPE